MYTSVGRDAQLTVPLPHRLPRRLLRLLRLPGIPGHLCYLTLAHF